MSALQPLNTLLEQTTVARDAALGVHRNALNAVAAAQAQATQLAEYRQEYAQRFGTQFQRAGAIELLQCYQGFMVRLDEAVSQQQRLLAQAIERGETAKAALLSAELRVASVRKLIERRIAEEVGSGVVEQLIILGPVAPSWKKGPYVVRGRGPRADYG